MRNGELVGPVGEYVHDLLGDKIHNESEVVWETRVRGRDGDLWPVWVRGYEGVYFVASPDYDDAGYFLNCDEAESYVFGNWFEVVEQREEEEQDVAMTGPTIVEVDEGDITCPTCGKTIIDEEGPGTQPSCAHVRFIYCNGKAFEYIDPELQKELDAEEASAEEKGHLFDTWEALRAHTGPDSIILEQTETGMACGPTSFTIWVGIRN